MAEQEVRGSAAAAETDEVVRKMKDMKLTSEELDTRNVPPPLRVPPPVMRPLQSDDYKFVVFNLETTGFGMIFICIIY